MASYVTPKKNAAFVFYASLEDQANAGLFKASPTLAAGDFKVSIDGGALTNLTDLPTVTPSGGRMVKVTLTASEMNGDNITVVASDASGAEWYDLLVNIQTTARQIDDLAYPATSGRSLTVAATGEAAANVTYQAGVAVAAADANGNVPVDVQTWRGGMPNELSAGAVSATVLTAVDVNLTSLVGVTEAIVKARGTIVAFSIPSYDVILSGTVLNSSSSVFTKLLDNQSWSIASQGIDVFARFSVPVGAQAQAVVVRANVSQGSPPTVYVSADASTWVYVDILSSNTMAQGEVITLVIPSSTAPVADESGVLYVRFTAGYYQDIQLDIDYCALICNAPATSINEQDIANAGLLAPVGVAAAGSAMDYLADILEDTGTTLPAVIAAVDSDVWSYATRTLTQSSTSTTDSTAAGSIARRRGDSWSISLTTGAITGYTSLWFTAKWDRDNTDAMAVIQIKKNASGTDDGLLYVNGAAATDALKGSITVSDASTGAIVIAVDETITDDLPPAGIYYDVQVLNAGTVSTLDSGTLTITADVTRAVA